MAFSDDAAARYALAPLNYFRLCTYWLPFELAPAATMLYGAALIKRHVSTVFNHEMHPATHFK
jgi:hypothetical protein